MSKTVPQLKKIAQLLEITPPAGKKQEVFDFIDNYMKANEAFLRSNAKTQILFYDAKKLAGKKSVLYRKQSSDKDAEVAKLEENSIESATGYVAAIFRLYNDSNHVSIELTRSLSKAVTRPIHHPN